MNYLLLGLIAVVLLAGLVAFGVGTKRWSWGTIVAGFLVLLSAAGYLYVAARFAAYEWSWTTFVRSKQVQVALQEDALVPDPSDGGRLKPAADSKPLATLVHDRDRWKRALERVETWRGRYWDKAAFQPPKADGETGSVELPVAVVAAAPAAEGEAPAEEAPQQEPKPPLDPGGTIYLFERVDDGIGQYLGAFLVQASKYDAGTSRFVLTVGQTAPRDAYDAEAWKQNYDDVTVFENLPVDRWLAFSRIERPREGEASMPQPSKISIDQVEALLDDRERQERFLEEVEEHDTLAPDKEDWANLRRDLESGAKLPGEYWARVKFKEPHALAEGLVDETAKRTFEVGEEAEFDLQTAFGLEDDDKATIEGVRYRRPLRDAATLIHGSRIFAPRAGGDAAFKEGMDAAGITTLVESLRQDLANLEASNDRLEAAGQSLSGELDDARGRRERLADDIQSWTRDAAAAERTADAFEAEYTRARDRLEATTATIVKRGAELRDAVARLVTRIDAAAPPAARPAAANR
ncbi:MAG: hypothetical protein K8S94_13365 [Planctomycetia bacterium]|nr:hypothetical protein [Planctomycetia bacterium]